MRLRSPMRHASIISICAVTASFTSGAHAEAASQSDDIIVTARGREEARIRVPDTITVFSARDIEARRLTTIDDIIAATPGVFMIHDQDPGTNLISVRGVSTNRNQSPSIAFIVDGLALPDAELFTLRPYDLARVELLKGPQGALFGRSASGGVINMITADPGKEWGGQASVGFGNGQARTADMAIDAPVNERLAFRLAGSFRTTDGFIYNSFLAKKVDGFTSRNLRLKARAELTDATTLSARIAWANEDGGAAYISSNNITGLYNGRLSGAALTNPFGDFEGRAAREWWGVQATLNHEFASGTRFSLTAGYDNYRKDFVEELDFRNGPVTFYGQPSFPNGIQPISQPVRLDAFTSEVRLSSADDQRLRWNMGVFFQRVQRDRTDDFGPLLFGTEAPRAETNSHQIGIFGQVNYDIAPELEATIALRYDRDRRKEDTVGVTTGTIFAARAATFGRWQPKLSLAWHPSEDLTVYATGAVGFKAGGFNPLPGASDTWQAIFPSEHTKALEAGVRSRLADGRVQLSLAGFITDYSNFQNTVFINQSVVLSVPKVNVHGLEATGQAQLGSGFSLTGSVAWTRSRVDQYTTPNPTPEPGEPLILDLAGKHTPNAPDWTANGGVQWAGDLGPMQGLARIDVSRVSRVYYEIDNILYSPGWTTVDARLALTRNAFTIDLWARNLFDRRWAISAFGQQQIGLLLGLGPGGPFDSFTINSGRQFGVGLTVRF